VFPGEFHGTRAALTATPLRTGIDVFIPVPIPAPGEVEDSGELEIMIGADVF